MKDQLLPFCPFYINLRSLPLRPQFSILHCSVFAPTVKDKHSFVNSWLLLRISHAFCQPLGQNFYHTINLHDHNHNSHTCNFHKVCTFIHQDQDNHDVTWAPTTPSLLLPRTESSQGAELLSLPQQDQPKAARWEEARMRIISFILARPLPL